MSDVKNILLLGAASFDIQNVANQLAKETLFVNPAPTRDFRSFTVHHDQPIQLTVAPGFMDHWSNTTPKWMASKIACDFKSGKHQKMFHVIVVVMSYPFLWTDEERKTVNFAYNLIGRDRLKSNGTLILNNGNNFQKKYSQHTLNEFKSYLKKQAEQQPKMQDFVGLFKENVLILDTELQDEELNRDQLERLFQTVATMDPINVQKQHGCHNTDKWCCCSVL